MAEGSEYRRSMALLLPDLRPGGAERISVNLLNELASRGYEVDCVLLQSTGFLISKLQPEVRLVDLQVLRFRKLLPPLVRYLRTARPEVLLACMWPLTVLALVACFLARTNTRVVVAEHTAWSAASKMKRPLTRWALKASMRSLFPFAHGVVAVSQSAANDLAEIAGLPRSRVLCIYNPIVDSTTSVKVRLPDTPVAWAIGNHRRILAVGTLTARKDYPTLLHALARLRERIDTRLLILGEGDERPSIEALAQTLGIAAFVEMPGFVPETAPYFAHADLYVMSSLVEGLPTVIVEALEQGTPVVSTDCPSGPREILADGRYGALVAMKDPDALAAAMLKALQEPSNRAALIQRAQDFSIKRATDEYVKLLFNRVPKAETQGECGE